MNMAKPEKVVVEGEIVSDSTLANDSKYQQYAQRPTDSALIGVWTFSIFALFFSFVPIFGLIISVFSLIVCVIKKIPPVLPVIGIIISTITTSLFLLLWLVIKAIF